MVTFENLTDNRNVKILDQKGCFTVLEYQRDMSVQPGTEINAYYRAKMGLRKRQVMAELSGVGVVTQAGAMQWTSGSVNATSGIKGAGDLFGKMIKGKATGESAVKPEYAGTGVLMLEPTYKYILLEDVSEWNGMVIEDGMFLACESTVKHSISARSNLSSAALGGEGLFNLQLKGTGIAVLESPVPREELIVFNLENDEVKIDGNMAVVWSSSLKFTVERSGKTLVGSAASGEGLVNVYRGTGKILMTPLP